MLVVRRGRVVAALFALLLANSIVWASSVHATSTGAGFVPVPYARIMGTNTVGQVAFGPQEVRSYQIAGKFGVPSSGVTAVSWTSLRPLQR